MIKIKFHKALRIYPLYPTKNVVWNIVNTSPKIIHNTPAEPYTDLKTFFFLKILNDWL